MKKLSLFEGFGVELEYMIVDRESLRLLPMADKLLFSVAGDYSGDVDRGAIAWSNELVNHVIELKTNGPADSLDHLPELFLENIREINQRLADFGAMLLPTASHPFMDPFKETVIWPHENSEIYSLYNKIFDCRGHGWSNVQSTHINLPFSGDEEFGRLHAAIRVLLPIIPALSASSPILDAATTDFHDTRLEYYRKNQARIPSICGGVIPERAFTEADYQSMIFRVIQEDVRPYDPEGILKKYFLNSRGAIARFDRGAVEIRIIDIQETPSADLAVLELIVAAVRQFADPAFGFLKDWREERLREIFLQVIRSGEQTMIHDPEYLGLFELHEPCPASECWKVLAAKNKLHFQKEISHILEHGSLSTRILRRLPEAFTTADLRIIYSELATCLENGKLFT